jgi:hypothetical protein
LGLVGLPLLLVLLALLALFERSTQRSLLRRPLALTLFGLFFLLLLVSWLAGVGSLGVGVEGG